MPKVRETIHITDSKSYLDIFHITQERQLQIASQMNESQHRYFAQFCPPGAEVDLKFSSTELSQEYIDQIYFTFSNPINYIRMALGDVEYETPAELAFIMARAFDGFKECREHLPPNLIIIFHRREKLSELSDQNPEKRESFISKLN